MTTQTKIKLDYQTTYCLFDSKLSKSNQLGKTALLHIKEGAFYTFLPINTAKKKVYAFEEGGIAKSFVHIYPRFLLDLLKTEGNTTCYFDATNFEYAPNFADPLFPQFGRFYNNEVYYEVEKQLANLNILSACHDRSYAIWHSLCLFTNFKSQEKHSKELTKHEISEICSQMSMVFLLAYDGEGYIIWDKNNILENYDNINGLSSDTEKFINDPKISDWTNKLEILHPDLEHPLPIGPHWDYVGPDFPKPGVRLMPDNSWVYKE